MKISKLVDYDDPQWAEKEVARVRAKRAKGIYYQLPYDDEDSDIDECYCVLIDPEGNELCYLGEPEDRTFSRDGKPVVEELNRLHSLKQSLVEAVNLYRAKVHQLHTDVLRSDFHDEHVEAGAALVKVLEQC